MREGFRKHSCARIDSELLPEIYLEIGPERFEQAATDNASMRVHTLRGPDGLTVSKFFDAQNLIVQSGNRGRPGRLGLRWVHTCDSSHPSAVDDRRRQSTKFLRAAKIERLSVRTGSRQILSRAAF